MIILEENEAIQRYCSDASNLQGQPTRVLVPETVQELCQSVRTCAADGISMGISGNGTGLVGGRVMPEGTLVSMEAFRNCQIDTSARRATVGCGLSMQEFQQAAQELGLLYPPDPTEWSAAMGGTWATNASGARTFKYGPTRSWVEALRVVLPDGEECYLRRGDAVAEQYHLTFCSLSGKNYSVDLPRYNLPRTSKHAAGYYTSPNMDAVDLFIGSEGTLGFLVEAELRLLPAPERVLGMIVFFESNDALLSCVESLRPTRGTDAPISPRLVEFFDRRALDFISPSYPDIPADAAAALWIEQEFEASREDEVFRSWTTFLQRASALADKAWYAFDERRHAEFRAFRHALPSAVYEKISSNKQSKIGTDIAVPEDSFREFFRFYLEVFAEHDVEYVLFGHIGNCHLHANIFSNDRLSYEDSIRIYDRCIEKGLSLGGTVSAEHGIGKLKRKYLEQMWGEEAIESMRTMRRALDPNALLSRGNMFL